MRKSCLSSSRVFVKITTLTAKPDDAKTQSQTNALKLYFIVCFILITTCLLTFLSRQCLNTEMAARVDDVMRLCCEISAHDQIKVAVKNSTKGALVAGGTAFVGGLLGGPPGIAVGKN